MIELRKIESWDDYLHDLFFSLGLHIEKFTIDAVEAGMMNYVFRVHTDKGVFFLKQALPMAKAGSELGPALRTISSQRLEYEKNCISKLGTILPEGVEIPSVHHYDPLNHILLLSDVAGEDGKLLETILKKGIFDVSTATAVGRFLGAMHRCTWGVPVCIRGDIRNDRKNWKRFLDMRTRGITGDGISPEILEALENLYEQTLRQHSHEVLIWMDCCPKNVIVRKDQKIGVFDFELASWVGDPAYDLGFLIGHYLIHVIQNSVPTTSLQAIAGCIQAYFREVEDMVFRGGMVNRMLKFAAATIIYRIAGASRLHYIEPESVSHLIQKAGALLCHDLHGEQDNYKSLIADVLA